MLKYFRELPYSVHFLVSPRDKSRTKIESIVKVFQSENNLDLVHRVLTFSMKIIRSSHEYRALRETSESRFK